MRTPRARRGRAQLAVTASIGLAMCAQAWAAPDFSGVWAMVQHDRLGAPFFILDQRILRRLPDLSF